MRVKVVYHQGEDLTIRTKMESGVLTLGAEALRIEGAQPLDLAFSRIQEVKLFRLHGLGRMIKVSLAETNFFVTVVRLNVAGFFVLINFFSTGDLFNRLKAAQMPGPPPAEVENPR